MNEKQNNMELLHHRHPKKVRPQAVDFLCILIFILGTTTGCSTHKHRYNGCKGYELRHYYNKDKKPGLLIHGRIRICDTRKIASFAKIRFVSKDSAVYEVVADKRGYYEIRIPKRYFAGIVEAFKHGTPAVSGNFTIEDVFFGYRGACVLNIDLYNTNNFYNEVELLKNDIILIQDNSKKKATDN